MAEHPVCFLLTITLAALSQLISKTVSAPFERVKIVEHCDRVNADDKRCFPTTRNIYVRQGQSRAKFSTESFNVKGFVEHFAYP